jgi:hypothetical protein
MSPENDGGESQGMWGAIMEGIAAVAPGLNFSDIVGDIGAEMGRLGVQGQMELASAIFGGDAFVPYGPGQYTPSPEHGLGQEAIAPPDQGMEMGGRSM